MPEGIPEIIAQRYEQNVPLSRLTRHPANFNDGDLGLLCTLLDANGFAGAVMAQESTGILIDGGTRLDAAEATGMPGLPVIWVDITDDHRDRLLAEWNESGRRGANDMGRLVAFLKGMAATADGLRGCVWDGSDLDAMVRELESAGGRPVHGDPDDAPDPPAEPVSALGDLWLLGPHRLLVGDATSPADVAALLQGEVCSAMWTDPPHGSDIVGGARPVGREQRRANGELTITGDTRDDQALAALLAGAWSAATTALRPGAPVYVCYSAGPPWHVPQRAFEGAGWRLRETLIWVKDTMVVSNLDYHGRHEPILYGFTPGGGKGRLGRGGRHWHGDDAQTSVLEIPRPSRAEHHPTMKPVELVRAHLANSTGPGQLVYDPFAGSGPVLIACHILGRTARLLEIEPRFADVICARWQQTAGETPILAATGEPVDFAPQPAPA